MGLPFSFYFPYIDLDDQVLKEFLVLFQGIGLLQPAFSAPCSTTEEAQQLGWVTIQRPLRVNLDAKHARAMLQEFARLGAMYQDSGYLAYLKHGGGHRLEEEPGYELVRKIREYGKGHRPLDDQESLRGQLLLQMAQDLDRQRREIQEALSEIDEQERSIRRQIVHDVDDEEALTWELEPLPGPEEDDFLIPQRLRAWAEMLEGSREVLSPLMVTDNRLAMAHLLDNGMEHHKPGEPCGPLVLLQLVVPRFAPRDLREVGRIRESVGEIMSWKVFCEKLEAFLGEVRLVPWSLEATQEAQARGRALASYFQEAVLDSFMEKVTALEPSWKEGWRHVTLEAILFPGITDGALLKGEGSAPPQRDRHAVVLHWERGAQVDFTPASR
jgi:hypothetical protein